VELLPRLALGLLADLATGFIDLALNFQVEGSLLLLEIRTLSADREFGFLA